MDSHPMIISVNQSYFRCIPNWWIIKGGFVTDDEDIDYGI